MENKVWNVIPTVSVNNLEFGIERSNVREILGKPKRIFKKTDNSVNTTDAYSDYHVYYTTDDKLEAIEFIGDNISISMNSHLIYPGTLNEARNLLPDLDEYFGFYISKAGSIGLCVEEDRVTSVLAGCKDYYKTI